MKTENKQAEVFDYLTMSLKSRFSDLGDYSLCERTQSERVFDVWWSDSYYFLSNAFSKVRCSGVSAAGDT